MGSRLKDRKFLRIGKAFKRADDLRSTINAQKSDLHAERLEKKSLVEKLRIANDENAQLTARVAALEADQAREESHTLVRLQQEITTLKRDAELWQKTIPEEDIRVELASLFEWELTVYRKRAAIKADIEHLTQVIGDLQSLERKAVSEGKTAEFEEIRGRISKLYDEIRELHTRAAEYQAIISSKIAPVIDRVMSTQYLEDLKKPKDPNELYFSQVDSECSSEDKSDTTSVAHESRTSDDKEGTDVPPVAKTTIAAIAIPVYQRIQALDKYPLPIILEGCERAQEIISLFNWFKSKGLFKSLSELVVLIDEDAFEIRISRAAGLDSQGWDMNTRMRARTLMSLLLEYLPIWTTDDAKSKTVNLRIDREGKLQSFLVVVDDRYKAHIAKLEKVRLPIKGIVGGRTRKSVPNVKPQKETRLRNGKSLPKSLNGKEDQLLEYVPPSLFLCDKGAGQMFARLLNGKVLESFEQALRDAVSKRLMEVAMANLQKGSSNLSIGYVEQVVKRIEASVHKLALIDEGGNFDRNRALARAREVLSTPKGRGAFYARKSAALKQHPEEV